jgi:chromosome segregation ATPase
MKESKTISQHTYLRTPDRYTDLSPQVDNNSEVYLRTKLNDAYSELENLKSVIKEIKTVDRAGLYDTNEHQVKRSTSQLHTSSTLKGSSKHLGTPSHEFRNKQTYEVINQFKDTLKETEKYMHRTDSMPKLSPTRMTSYNNVLLSSPKSYLSGVNTNAHHYRSTLVDNNNYPSLTEYYGKYSVNGIKDDQERFKTTNHILNRSNLDLRNQIRLLQMELETYKNNAKFANGYFDQNINEFIENMKNSLNTCQINNKEYEEVIEKLQKDNVSLMGEVNHFKEQADFTKRELEIMSKKLQELKIDLEDTMHQNKSLSDEKIFLEIQINEKENKLGELIEKINSLLKLNDNQSKNRGESNALIESLNGTIEFLRKTQGSYDQEKVILKGSIEELQNEIMKKNYEIEALTEKIALGSKDKHFYFSELDMIRNEFKNNQKYLDDLQTSYKKLLSDLEKERMKSETAEVNIQEKDQIIENMKKTINYLTKCLEDYKEQNDRFKAENDSLHLEHSKFIKNIEINELKLKDINSHLNEIQLSKETLHKRNLELEAECNNKTSKLSQFEFEYKIEKQKVEEQVILINKLKEENKTLKIANVENAYSLDYAKKHEETLTKLNSLSYELSTKNTEINHLKLSYEEQIRIKNEEIKSISISLRDYQSNSKDREFRTEINNLQNEIDRITRDFKRKLDEIEEQKTNILRKYEKLNSEYEILHSSFDKLDIEHKQLGRDKRRTEDYELELTQYRQKIEKLTTELSVMENEYKKALKDRKKMEEYEQDKLDMEKKYAAMSAELDKLMEEQKKAFKEIKRIEELEYEINIKNKKIEQLQNDLDNLDINYKKASAGKKKAEDIESEKAQLMTKLNKLQDEHNKLQEDYKKATSNKRKVEDYELDIQQLTKKCEKLQADYNQLNEDYKKASSNKRKIEDYEANIQQLTKKYEKLQTDYNQLNDDYKKAVKERSKIDDIEYEKKQLFVKYEKLQAECDKLNEQYRKAVADGKRSGDIEFEKNSLQKKYDTLRNEYDRLNDDYKKSISSKKKIDDYEYEISGLQKRYDKLVLDHKSLTADYNNAISAGRNKISDSDYNNLLSMKEKLQNEFSVFKGQHYNCARDIETKNKLIASLQSQMDELSIRKSRVVINETPRQVYNYDAEKGNFNLILEVEKYEYKKSVTVRPQVQVDLSQINCKFSGSEWLLTIYDSTRVLSYNLKSQKFELIKFTDKENKFQKNYVQEGSLYLNDKDGLFIITGSNFDQFFFFKTSDNTMTHISQLKTNHMNGGLVVDGFRNTLICLSGSKTNSVEKYYDDCLIKGYFSFEGKKYYSSTSWSSLPELKYDRANAGYVNVNDCIYAIFGYSNSEKRYIETIERLNLANCSMWEEVKLSISPDISNPQLKSFICLEDSDNNRIVIFGGQDGATWKTNKLTLNYNYIQNSLTINNQFPMNNNNSLFNRVTAVVPAYLDNTFGFAGFDDDSKAYLFDPSKSKFNVFCYP